MLLPTSVETGSNPSSSSFPPSTHFLRDGLGGGGGQLVHDEGQRRQVVRGVRQARRLRLSEGKEECVCWGGLMMDRSVVVYDTWLSS